MFRVQQLYVKQNLLLADIKDPRRRLPAARRPQPVGFPRDHPNLPEKEPKIFYPLLSAAATAVIITNCRCSSSRHIMCYPIHAFVKIDFALLSKIEKCMIMEAGMAVGWPDLFSDRIHTFLNFPSFDIFRVSVNVI